MRLRKLRDPSRPMYWVWRDLHGDDLEYGLTRNSATWPRGSYIRFVRSGWHQLSQRVETTHALIGAECSRSTGDADRDFL